MEKIKKIVLDLVKKVGDNQNITEKSLLLDEGWIDSLSTITLLSELENKFSIEIETEELSHENFNTTNSFQLFPLR